MQEVGELHVDRFHGARVLHDPMFVHIRGIVVARGAERAKEKEKGDGYVKKMHYLGFIVLPFNSRRSPKNILDMSTSERLTAKGKTFKMPKTPVCYFSQTSAQQQVSQLSTVLDKHQ